MKTIAISACGRDLDACVEPRFGRTRFFVLVDPNTEDWESFDNMANISSLQDVGILTAKNLTKNQAVKTVLTGHCGPKAFKELKEAGVKVFLNAGGTVRFALNKLLQGELQESAEPNVPIYQGQFR